MLSNSWLRAARPSVDAAIMIACVAVTSAAGILSDSAVAAEKLIGKQAPDFRLADSAGKEHALADLRDARFVVVAFVGTECPLAKLYAARLNGLAAKYAERGVRFIAIDSNVQDTAQEIAAYALEHELSFPVLKDPDNRIADQFAAVRTPEVFLLDTQRVICYHGRIDDQFGVGLQKNQPSRATWPWPSTNSWQGNRSPTPNCLRQVVLSAESLSPWLARSRIPSRFRGFFSSAAWSVIAGARSAHSR